MTSPGVRLLLNGQDGTVQMRRCNPFGHATDAGPKHLMGGMFGPQYEGRFKWNCENVAEGRWRMTCRCDQTRHVPAPVMELCRDHVAQILRRMSDACTTCLLPQENIELALARLRTQDEFYRAIRAPGPSDMVRATAARLAAKLEAIDTRIDEMTCHACLVPGNLPHAHPAGRPLAHKCKLTMTELS
jgi:hypothetical protein